MYCKKCGKEISDNSTFCNKCGADQTSSSSKILVDEPVAPIYSSIPQQPQVQIIQVPTEPKIKGPVKKCRKCKMDMPKRASKCPHCGSGQTSPFMTLLAIFIVIGAVWLFFGNRNKTPSTSSSSGSSSTTTTSATKSELEQEMEEKGYVWGNKSLSLAITKDNTCKTSEYSTIISGVIYNASKTNYSYLQVSFALYDENDMKIGNAWTNIAGLKSGESWKFEATYLGKCSKYKLDELTGY